MNQYSNGRCNPDALCKISLVKCTQRGTQEAHLLSQLFQNVRFGSRHFKPTFAGGRAHHLESLQVPPCATGDPLVLSHAAPPPRIAKVRKWSGWQELNLRGHVPKTCGWPLPYTRI